VNAGANAPAAGRAAHALLKPSNRAVAIKDDSSAQADRFMSVF